MNPIKSNKKKMTQTTPGEDSERVWWDAADSTREWSDTGGREDEGPPGDGVEDVGAEDKEVADDAIGATEFELEAIVADVIMETMTRKIDNNANNSNHDKTK